MDPVRLIQIIFFLGLVIFVHELGHFLVARWCGVLVERFSIGFGPVILAFKRGDTEYAISAIPLGGYVKMLGQSDTPTADEPTDDLRSYQNKSVPQRMAIISAGVVMNILFGMVCFAVAYKVGVPYSPATVGAATPGRPAWMAGLEPGDHIIDINGHRQPSYETFLHQVMFTRPGSETVDLVVDRGGKEVKFSISPEKLDRPIIGVTQSLGLTIAQHKLALPTERFSAAAEAHDPGFERGDLVVAVNGAPVQTYQEFDRLCYDHRTEPVQIRVERQGSTKSEPRTADITVPPAFVRTLGMRMTMGDITAVRKGSPAANATDANGQPKPIEPEDRIIAVDGNADFDPMKLSDMISAKAGQRVELTIRRKARTPGEHTVYVVPDDVPPWQDIPHIMLPMKTPMSVPAIGLAYNVGSIVHQLEPGGPAEKTGTIKPGDVVSQIEYFVLPRPSEESPSDELESYRFACEEPGWPGAFWGFQSHEVRMVKLMIKRRSDEGKSDEIEVELEPTDDSDWPMQLRGLNLETDYREQKAESVAQAFQMGFDYTWVTLSRVYMTLRGLVYRDLSPELLSGPLRLGYTAYVVSEDFMTLLRLIGLININLAVVNFLPIPVLDGGHMVFLLYEAIARRKPSEWVVQACAYFGLACILLLMSFVLYLDLRFFWTNS